MESDQFVEPVPSPVKHSQTLELDEMESWRRYSKKIYNHDTFEVQLLPGIPNRITLNQITTKLPWKALLTLPLLSRSWRQAIRSHQVHDARARSRSAQTLIVVNYIQSKDVHVLSLYSMADKIAYGLPAIPRLRKGFSGGCPRSCQSIWLEGKIYVLGGVDDPLRENSGSTKVYVLDLAGQQGWKECASMLEPRQKFGCGVMDGKIYVFGGIFLGRPVFGSEVYNPKVDVWSSIEPMETYRYDHSVSSSESRKSFLVHGGKVFDPELVQRWSTDPAKCGSEGYSVAVDAEFFEDYNPRTDEWRSVLPPSGFNHFKPGLDSLLVVEGKLYWVTPLAILVFDKRENTWRHLHSFSFPEFGPIDRVAVWPSAIIAVGDELLAVAHWYDIEKAVGGACLVQSRGLGREIKQIVWQGTQSSLQADGQDWLSALRYFMYPIRL